MANPQVEDGYTKIANEIMDALCRSHPGGSEGQVLWAIIRKTYGWSKAKDKISISQLCALTGCARRTVIYAIQNLESKNMITVTRHRVDNMSDINVISFQKDYEKWVVQEIDGSARKSKGYKATIEKQKANYKNRVVQEIDGSARKAQRVVQENENGLPFLAPTKETITKETITKAIELPDGLSKETFSEYLELRKKLKRPLIEKSYPRFFSHLLKICKETRASPESIINQSLVNSWQGIFPLKQEDNYANTTTGYKKPISQIRGNFRSEQRGLDPKIEAETDAITREYYANLAAINDTSAKAG